MDRKAQIRAFIVENFLFGDAGSLTTAQSLLATGVMDSTGVLELIAYLEQTYGISIGDREVVPGNLDSIDSVAEFVGRKLAARQQATVAGS